MKGKRKRKKGERKEEEGKERRSIAMTVKNFTGKSLVGKELQ